jgi:hypothetical protein
VTYHDLDVESVREQGLELFFPVAHSIPVTPSGITEDQQLAFITKAATVFTFPPPTDRFNGKCCRVTRGAYIDISMIMSWLINPVGNALEFTRLGLDKVVSLYLLRGLAPLLSGILEVANRLFFLRGRL